MAFPIDVAIAVSRAGIDIHLPEDDLMRALRSAIADRRGYLDAPELTNHGFRITLLSPERMEFEGRTLELALAWCLLFLMSEQGEIGVGGFST